MVPSLRRESGARTSAVPPQLLPTNTTRRVPSWPAPGSAAVADTVPRPVRASAAPIAAAITRDTIVPIIL